MKRQMPPQPGLRRAFTLMELLIVITIIGILISILVPIGNQAGEQQRKLRASKGCADLTASIAAYYGDYSKFPNVVNTETAIPTDGSTGLMAVLVYLDNNPVAARYNPRGTNYFSDKAPKISGGAGLEISGNGSNAVFYDAWSIPGEPRYYYVTYDKDNNGRISVPNKNGGEEVLYGTNGIAVWSRGPDGEEGTRDDVIN